MSLTAKLLSASGGGVDKLYVDDVFQAFTRTGTGADVTVTTGIDMTKGYMLWSKGRSGATDHAIYDSARGVTFDLTSNTTAAQTTQATGLKSVSVTGHTIGSLGKMNTSGTTYVDFVIRKAPKFFDVVTYTGNGVAGRQIPHSLDVAPGMIIVKSTTGAGYEWKVWHRSFASTWGAVLNNTAAASIAIWPATAADATNFYPGNNAEMNGSGQSFVAYLFAHDPSADGVIQCGIYTGNSSSSGPTVGLGWEPQYVLVKGADHATDWRLWDSSRGLTNNGGNVGTDPSLALNQASVEVLSGDNQIRPLSTGFQLRGSGGETNFNGYKYIYLAIRRPNKPPTTGTQVYNAIARTGTDTATTITGVGFAPDFISMRGRSYNSWAPVWAWMDRLRGGLRSLGTSGSSAEVGNGYVPSFNMDGVIISDAMDINNASETYINHFFKRAPGVFDVVTYTGTGVAKTEAHGLGVVPELIIFKVRSASASWFVLSEFSGSDSRRMYLELTSAGVVVTYGSANFLTATPTATSIPLGAASGVNTTSQTLVAYLFATKAGISKVSSYTGNGTTQTINCGFTTGARFILIKRTDSAGDWYIWDTARGIVSANDPHLSLNTTAAEVTTDDSVDPDVSGFIVNQVAATNINVSAASYIFLAIA